MGIVFYSWQAWLPNATNRGFIEDALEKAVVRIGNDGDVTVVPVVDRDTAGLPGAPDIAASIFKKIDAASVFVADVTNVSGEDARAAPNPNVSVETGYALRELGPERLILVMNKAFGKIEDLPFDLRMRRILTYELRPGDEGKAAERNKLTAALEAAIRAVLALGSRSQSSFVVEAADKTEIGFNSNTFSHELGIELFLDVTNNTTRTLRGVRARLVGHLYDAKNQNPRALPSAMAKDLVVEPEAESQPWKLRDVPGLWEPPSGAPSAVIDIAPFESTRLHFPCMFAPASQQGFGRHEGYRPALALCLIIDGEEPEWFQLHVDTTGHFFFPGDKANIKPRITAAPQPRVATHMR